jgi:uncharacterized protein (TIGR03437 family)
MRLLTLTALTLSFAATLAAAPAITAVYNAASWLPPSLPNSGVAQGAIFTVKGTGLGPATLQQVQSYPLPTTQGLAGTTAQVKVGAVTEACIMVYTVATQVAAILPSATPVGSGTLTVSYQGGSSSIAIQVLAADFGTFTLNEGGTGPGVFTDTSYNPITMINPATPGETLILWGSGLGAVTGDETEPPQQVDLGTGVQVQVGNQPAMVLYGGRGSSPGLDQINFVVPAGVNGCRTSVAVTVKGVTGNVTTMAVAPQGQSTCGDTYGYLTAANLQKAVASGTLNIAYATLSRIAGDEVLTSEFESWPINSLIRSYGGSFGASIGSCTAYELLGSSLVLADPIQPSYLNAGPQLTLTGPNGTKTVNATSTGSYLETLATASPFYLAPGNYTVTNGAGGPNVGPFNWTMTLPANVVPTNLPSRVNRAQDLTLTWTGGTGFQVVTLLVYAGVPVSLPQVSYAELICTADPSAGQFTIPSALLNLLPTNGYGSPDVPGVAIQIAGDTLNDFTVAGSPGIDEGIFSAFITTGVVTAIQ